MQTVCESVQTVKGVHTCVRKLSFISSGPATDRVSVLCQCAAELDRQSQMGRAKQAERDRQSETGTAKQAQQDRQRGIDRAGQQESDRQRGTDRVG